MTKIKIEVEINASNLQHIAAMNVFLNALAASPSEENETPKQENTPKEATKTKKPAKKLENTKGSQEKEPEKQPENGSEKISLTELRAILSTKVNEHRSEIKNKLTEFGASSLSTLESSHYQAFADFLNSL